jgi:hypothetical protein
VELVVDRRIVQGWRVVDWDPGIYSIAKFELKDDGARTMVVLDQSIGRNTRYPHGVVKPLHASVLALALAASSSGHGAHTRLIDEFPDS